MVATDASTSFGFVLAVAPASLELVRAIAAAACNGDCVVRLTRVTDDAKELPRGGVEFRLPLKIQDFKPLLSVKGEILDTFR